MPKETKSCILQPHNYSCQECQYAYHALRRQEVRNCPSNMAYDKEGLIRDYLREMRDKKEETIETKEQS